MKRLALFAVCIASLFIGVGSASAGSPIRSHWQTVCFMGKYGQPGGCRTFLVVTGPVAE